MHTDAHSRGGRSGAREFFGARRHLVLGAAAGFIAVPVIALVISAYTMKLPAPAEVDYARMLPNAVHDQMCGSQGGREQGEITIDGGLKVNVRTPLNYDRELRHPLLVAFPPGGYGRRSSEAFYGLTAAATARGFIVAFPEARPLSRPMINRYSKVSEAVAGHWCTDAKRVAFLGHSDGASATYGISLLEKSAIQPRAVLVSAAGLSGSDLASESCPSVQWVMIVHGNNDALFPGFGREASLWWGKCFGCTPDKSMRVSPRCVEAQGCRKDTRLVFCATDAAHTTAPEIGDFELDFLQQGLNVVEKKE